MELEASTPHLSHDFPGSGTEALPRVAQRQGNVCRVAPRDVQLYGYDVLVAADGLLTAEEVFNIKLDTQSIRMRRLKQLPHALTYQYKGTLLGFVDVKVSIVRLRLRQHSNNTTCGATNYDGNILLLLSKNSMIYGRIFDTMLLVVGTAYLANGARTDSITSGYEIVRVPHVFSFLCFHLHEAIPILIAYLAS